MQPCCSTTNLRAPVNISFCLCEALGDRRIGWRDVCLRVLRSPFSLCDGSTLQTACPAVFTSSPLCEGVCECVGGGTSLALTLSFMLGPLKPLQMFLIYAFGGRNQEDPEWSTGIWESSWPSNAWFITETSDRDFREEATLESLL